jgi:hypothetical protein
MFALHQESFYLFSTIHHLREPGGFLSELGLAADNVSELVEHDQAWYEYKCEETWHTRGPVNA